MHIIENEIYKGDFIHGKRTKKSKAYLEVLNDIYNNRIINNDTRDDILNDKNRTKKR